MGDINNRKIRTVNAPHPVGPYSQAIRSSDLVFIAGQLGIDPQTGKLVEGGIKAQTRQVLDNLSAIAAESGASLANVVKTTVFLTDFDEFAAMNEVYAVYFGDSAPARSTIGVARLPLNGVVEIEAILSSADAGAR